MEKLIALVDISDTVKAGDEFDAPDRIFVALQMAKDADHEHAAHVRVPRRRPSSRVTEDPE